MPATSEKQRKLMGLAEHHPEKVSKKNRGVLKMDKSQLHDFASTKGLSRKKETHEKDGRSLVDMEFIDENEGVTSKLPGHGWLSKPGTEGHVSIEGLSNNRDSHDLVGAGIPVTYRGPDTAYRVEEINPQHYGRDYEPGPYKDLFKTPEKAWEYGIRRQWDDYYQDCESPGAVTGEEESSLAYGTVGYKKVPVELEDNRTYERQQAYRRVEDEHIERDEDDPDAEMHETYSEHRVGRHR